MNHSPRIHPLAAACSKAHGYSLLEVSLALAAAAAIGVTTFLVFKPSDTVAAVKTESAQLAEFSQKIETSFGMVGNYGAAVTNRAISDGLVPAGYLASGSGSLRNRWGGDVVLEPYSVAHPDDAFLVRYTSVPAEACTQLASSMAANVYDMKVAGASVFAGGDLEPGALVACGAGPMEFVFYSGLVSQAAVAVTPVPNPPTVAPPPSAPPVPPGAPVAPPTAPPVVVPPPIIVTPPPVTPPPVVTPPPGVAPPPGVTPPPACTVNCNPAAPPPPYTATCEDRRAPAENRTQACPAGFYGSRQEGRTQFCPGGEAWATPEWTAWAQTGSTCTPCPGPQPETASRWEARSLACPSGSTGTWTREYAQSASRTGTTYCPAGTWTLPAPTWGAWSAWSDTGATRNDNNQCAANCVLPTPSTESQTRTLTETRTVACPAPETGSGIGQVRSLQQQATRSAFCPAPTGPFAWSAWGAWVTTGTGAWAETSRDCNAPAATFPAFSGNFWHNWGDGAYVTGWGIYCPAPTRPYPEQSMDPSCLWMESTNDGSTWTPNPPQYQTPTPAYSACIAALNGGGPTLGTGTTGPAACSCSLLGPGARIYRSTPMASDWQGEEFICPP